MDRCVLYVSDGCEERRILCVSFKNGKHTYKITSKGCSYEFSKDIYNIRLGEWSYLCD